MDKYSDYIVVGGGASGCALTHKILKSKKSVTLIEAGYSNYNFFKDNLNKYSYLINLFVFR